MRVALAVATVYFLFCAFVQLNDPDPAVWISFYVAAATATVRRCFRQGGPALPAVLAGLAALWAATLAPAFARTSFDGLFGRIGMVDLAAEEARESLGLFIAALILAATAYGARRQALHPRGGS